MPSFLDQPDGDDDEPLLRQHSLRDEAKFDITALIDLVFMMNIYFLVVTITAALSEMDLPTARKVASVDLESSILISILQDTRRAGGTVYIGDGPSGDPLEDAEDQKRTVREAVEDALRDNRKTVVIKAEKAVKLRDVVRVASAAGAVPGAELQLAVIEAE